MSLKKNLASMGLFLFIFSPALFAQNDFPLTGAINNEGANIRSDATINSSVICNASKGERLEVVLERYGWYKIKLPQSCPCYIRADMAECIALPEGTCRSVKVIKNRVNIRLKPQEDSPVVGRCDENEVLTVSAQIGNWYRIFPTASSFGWINKKLLSKISAASAQPQVKKEEAINLPVKEKEEKLFIAEGIIEPYGMVFGRVATHKLKADDGSIYLLKGNKKGLDTVNYRKVKIEGMVLEGKTKKFPLVEIKKMEVVD